MSKAKHNNVLAMAKMKNRLVMTDPDDPFEILADTEDMEIYFQNQINSLRKAPDVYNSNRYENDPRDHH